MKQVQLCKLFDIQSGNKLDYDKLIPSPQGVFFVSRSGINEGVRGRVACIERLKPFPKGAITAALGGSTLSCFVQQEPFYTAQNINILVPKQPMSLRIKWFYCMCIKMNAYKYSTYGREANVTFHTIEVPNLNDIPDWVEKTHIFDAPSSQPYTEDNVLPARTDEWQFFSLRDLFKVMHGNKCCISKMKTGNTPLVSSTQYKNGVSALVDGKGETLLPAGLITIACNGSVGEVFYQSRPFLTTTDVNVLHPRDKEFNKYSAMFICVVIRHEQYRFNYGRKWGLTAMRKHKIKLPANSEGQPDWLFMEEYIKTLPYSKAL